MTRRGVAALTIVWLAIVVIAAQTPAQPAYDWKLPAWMAPPPVPADNPMSDAKVELGRRLFYDTRLSGTGTQSCASCHQQSLAFTDGRARGVGSTGEDHPRGSMSLVNVGYASSLTWANPAMKRLEEQALVPMYGEHPVELGLSRSDEWLQRLGRDPIYQKLTPAAFPGDTALTRDHVTKALAAFQRSIVSTRSPFDRYRIERDESAISDAAKNGEALFRSRMLACSVCHGGTHFSAAMGREMPGMFAATFHNTGLYNLAGQFSYPTENTGLFEITKQPRDVGKFKPPTLRNIAVTAPYMHDGSIATLEEALDHYASGGRTITSGPYQGVGRDNPNKTSFLRGFELTPAQRADLIAFLTTLTDEALLKDDRFANPWKK